MPRSRDVLSVPKTSAFAEVSCWTAFPELLPDLHPERFPNERCQSQDAQRDKRQSCEQEKQIVDPAADLRGVQGIKRVERFFPTPQFERVACRPFTAGPGINRHHSPPVWMPFLTLANPE